MPESNEKSEQNSLKQENTGASFIAPSAQLNWTNQTPHSLKFDDCYYSSQDGLAESEYVFLAGNNLPQSWLGRKQFSIAELGFGSGLNFLASWRSWELGREAGSSLNFLSLEMQPLTREDIAKALSVWPELAPYASKFLAQYPIAIKGIHRITLECLNRKSSDDFGSVQLTLIFGDATEELAKINASIDAWFLDGFAPAKNPELWSAEVLAQVARLSRVGTSFATFSSASSVRKSLQELGFEVEKIAGFGRKREMLRGVFQRKQAQTERTCSNIRSVAVIGGGLAGCLAAYSLAKRGIHVTLIERQVALARGASGNAVGVVMPYLSATASAMNSFYLAGYLYARQQIDSLRAAGLAVDGSWCGALRLPLNKTLQRTFAALAAGVYPRELAAVADPEQGSSILGLSLAESAIYYPGAGWVSPGDYCRAAVCSVASLVKTKIFSTAISLEAVESSWRVVGDDGLELALADAVVISSGYECQSFPQTAWVPVSKLRGQTMQPEQSEVSAGVKAIFCYENYFVPAGDHKHFLGATYDRISESEEIIETQEQELITKLVQRLPELEGQIAVGPGRVGFRTVSPDHLPLIGEVISWDKLDEARERVADNRLAKLTTAEVLQARLPGLFLNVGHGSRGLISCGLAGELLAGLICEEPLPLLQPELDAVAPGRFLRKAFAKEE